MADAATADNESWSLRETFSKANHVRHWVMDASMISAAIGAVVLTGGTIGLLDPLGPFLAMHVSGFSSLFEYGGQFLSSAFGSAAGGEFFTDNFFADMGHGSHGASSAADAVNGAHAAHGAKAGEEMIGHCTKDAFNQVMQTMSPDDFEFNQELAGDSKGDFLRQVEGLCHGME